MIARARLIVAALAMVCSFAAHAQLYGTSPFTNGGGALGALFRFHPDTGDRPPKTGVQVTLAGFTVTGVTGLTQDPTTLTEYAILKVSGVSGRVLATIDVETGVATQVGNLGDNFSSISFREDGQMFGMTGDGASVPETLWLIDKANATKTVATALPNGADGDIIAYNPVDDFFYHWSGNDPIVYERVESVAPYTVTNIPIIGATDGETFGAVWDGCLGEFIGSNIGSSYNRWSPNGTVSPRYGSNPDDIRGMVLIGGNTCDLDLSIDVDANPKAPTNGQPMTITLTVLNNGEARSLTTSLAITVPPSITGLATSGCAQDPMGVPACTIPGDAVLKGELRAVTITGTSDGGAGTISATVTTTSDETMPADNTASLTLGDALFSDGFET